MDLLIEMHGLKQVIKPIMQMLPLPYMDLLESMIAKQRKFTYSMKGKCLRQVRQKLADPCEPLPDVKLTLNMGWCSPVVLMKLQTVLYTFTSCSVTLAKSYRWM